MSDVIRDRIGTLRGQIDAALRDVITGLERPAVLEFPSYPNVGDSAIWLGQLKYLFDRAGCVPYRTADMYSYSRDRLSTQVGVDSVLISGGGSLGDLWKWTLEAKIRVLDDFAELPVVQLPQSMHFVDPTRFEEYRRAVSRHRAFTLLVRDQASFELAREKLDCEVRLCPDMALWLDLKRRRRPQHDVVYLLRTDKEAGSERPAQNISRYGDVVVFDWLREPSSPTIAAERLMTGAITRYPRRLAFLETLLNFWRNRVADLRLRRGCALLSSGKVVVTDRLHGHILCVLLGIPHVLLDNSYGKLQRFYDCWTSDCADARFATSIEEAIDIARGLVRTH